MSQQSSNYHHLSAPMLEILLQRVEDGQSRGQLLHWLESTVRGTPLTARLQWGHRLVERLERIRQPVNPEAASDITARAGRITGFSGPLWDRVESLCWFTMPRNLNRQSHADEIPYDPNARLESTHPTRAGRRAYAKRCGSTSSASCSSRSRRSRSPGIGRRYSPTRREDMGIVRKEAERPRKFPVPFVVDSGVEVGLNSRRVVEVVGDHVPIPDRELLTTAPREPLHCSRGVSTCVAKKIAGDEEIQRRLAAAAAPPKSVVLPPWATRQSSSTWASDFQATVDLLAGVNSVNQLPPKDAEDVGGCHLVTFEGKLVAHDSEAQHSKECISVKIQMRKHGTLPERAPLADWPINPVVTQASLATSVPRPVNQ